jgi:sugar (pentulose or hexulose) kinase
VEATALGNVLMQAVALGHIESLEHARQLVCTSFPPSLYQPGQAKAWDQAYERLLETIK